MQVILVSHCQHKALSKTRTLLDRYATRIGDNVWTTPITQDALESLHMALRKIASRNTSVVCYKNHATLGMKLCWIVGNSKNYDSLGNFSISQSIKKVPFPMLLRHASLVAKLSGYLHDLGKANVQFQNKLNNSLTSDLPQGDAIRHEWISAWLSHQLNLESINGIDLDTTWSNFQKLRLPQLKSPVFLANPPLNYKDASIWAIATHHGAMGGTFSMQNGADSTRHVRPDKPMVDNQKTNIPYQALTSKDMPQDLQRWQSLFNNIQTVAQRLKGIQHSSEYWQMTTLIARAALILADHKVSSETFPYPDKREKGILYANTKKIDMQAPVTIKRKKKADASRFLDQPLSWHLSEVGNRAPMYVRMFDEQYMPCVSQELVDATLSSRAPLGSRFVWQDHSVDYVQGLNGSKLIFNVATTGAGKTLANLKLAFAMRPEKVRVAAVFNLRSLTQQTFSAFATHLAMANPDLFKANFACLLGERLKKYPEFSEEDEDDVVNINNNTFNTDVDVEECTTAPPQWMLELAGASEGLKKLTKLIAAPVLVSTMDWIVAAGEPGQQARHVKALLRVATSDLILDELDSYDVKASVAVMKVIQLAAAFGRNVIVSSATLNHALVEGISEAYAAGQKIYQKTKGQDHPWHLITVQDNVEILPCSKLMPTPHEMMCFYRDLMEQVALKNAVKPVTKRFFITNIEHDFFGSVSRQAFELHEQWKSVPIELDCSLSIGLIRVANIQLASSLSEYLRQSGHFVVCAYHARDVASRRLYKEYYLDHILNRHNNGWIEHLKKAYPEIVKIKGDLRLLVVATPVEEVGRDHDFDWCVIEPSSMHSIVQTAGRVNRHRRIVIAEDKYNVAILNFNWKEYQNPGEPCFVYPGLELSDPKTHPQHQMEILLRSTSNHLDNTLDSGLVFDSRRKTLFAQYDEKAIHIEIQKALPVLANHSGFSMGTMIKLYMDSFPLRERNYSYQYELQGDQAFYSCFDGIKNGTWKQTPPPEGTWLTPVLSNTELPALFSVSSPKPQTISSIEIKWNDVVVK